MKKQAKSQSQNAKARKRSSSKDALSGNSAKKKSGKSKPSSESLKINTPTSSRLRALQEAGIIAPDEIPSNDEEVPLDFTTTGNKEIGGIHSRFAVRHAHAIYHVALASARLVHLKRDLRIAQAKFRMKHTDEKKNVVDAMMQEDDDIVKLFDKIAVKEAEVEILQAVASGYEDLRNAASREISRRIGERAPSD